MDTAARESYEATFRRTYPSALRLATRIVGSAEAEDVTVDAFSRALVRWDRLSREPWVDAWILRATSNAALDVLRRRRRRRRDQPFPDAVVAADDELSALRLTLRAALASLPRRQAEVLTLRYLAGLPEPAVAAALGISLGSVKTHARRALASLRLDDSLLDLDPHDETSLPR